MRWCLYTTLTDGAVQNSQTTIGSNLRNIEIAAKGKRDGISTEIISASTGLSKEEIEKIPSE